MAQNGIVGDNMGMDLPQTQVPKKDLSVEKNMAKFSKTKEYEALKEHLESRIGFYQGFLPDGRPINSQVPTAEQWAIANAIIGEFRAVIDVYESAAENVNVSR